MIKVLPSQLRSIEEGQNLHYMVKLYLNRVFTFTREDYLKSIGDLTTEIADSYKYEASNTNVVLENTDFYFSKLLYTEYPIDKTVEIYLLPYSILMYRGLVTEFILTPVNLTLMVNS